MAKENKKPRKPYTREQRKRIRKDIGEMSYDELDGFVEEQSQSPKINPDVEERDNMGIQYARGTKFGRQKYAEAKALGAARLDKLGKMVAKEQQKRSDRAAKLFGEGKNSMGDPLPTPPVGSIFEVREDDSEEDGMSMAQVVEKRLAEQQLATEPREIDFVEEDEPSGGPLIEVEDIDVSEPMLRAEPVSEPMLREEPVPELSEEESGRLFKMIMGSSFDPVSSMDKGKMEILKKAKAENPDLSDSQLALKIYKDYM